jgi:GT2 family glycosyltransferase
MVVEPGRAGTEARALISAVIVTHDSARCVAGCLTSVRRALPDAEVLVVDNNSRDDTAAVARSAGSDVRLIELDENLGFGRACNLGVEQARHEHVLLLNPDTRVAAVDRGGLARLLSRRRFGLVAPALDTEPERTHDESRWQRELIAHTLMMLRPREWRPRPLPAGDGRSTWVSAAMLLVTRAEFVALGGFDPRFFLYYEDRDLCRRYRDSRFTIETTRVLHGTHEGGGSSTHDGLRAAPIGWGLLGWLQYVSIRDGTPAARTAARATVRLLRTMRTGLAAPERAGWQRAGRKRRQVDDVLVFIRERAASGDERFCPDALDALRELL